MKEIYYFFRYRFPNSIRDKWMRFKGFFQRGKKGYAYYDLWSFDWYLSGVIGKGLKELAEKHTGYPPDLTDEEWTNILNSMADGFLNYYEKEFNTHCEEADYEKLKVSLELFKTYFLGLWD